MTFLNEAKRISSQFFRATKSLASDAIIELTYQYHFAVLRQIGKTYALEEEAEKLTERIKDNDDRGCNFSSPSDWLEEQLKAPDDGFGLPDTYERTNIQSDFAIDDPAFETEAETDAFKFVEMKQNISDDGLNEPDYPYDTEPSA